MTIKKKDIKSICELIVSLTGPFTFFGTDGKILFESPEVQSSKEPRVDVFLNNSLFGHISGASQNLCHVASLLSLYLKTIEEKKLLTEHTLQKYREMGFISGINKLLSSSPDVFNILASTTTKIHEIINVEACSVLVADQKSGKFILKVISGRIVDENLELNINEGIAGRVLETGLPIIANNTSEHPYFLNTGAVEIKSLLCLPLKVKDTTFGILNLRNKADGIFTSEDEALMSSLCVMVAEVIENARLLEDMIKSEKFTAIGQMASGIIHDIKNPMTTIKGFAGLMGDMEFTKEERKEYCTMITSEVDRLVSMVEDLLAFAKGFKSKLNIEKSNAEKYFLDIVPYVEKSMTARNIMVVSSLDYINEINIDLEKFKRVIFNIAGNAREAMHQGGKFLILTRQLDNGIEIVFSDTGNGIPDEIIDTIFEPFVTKGKKSGTGLGLAISKKIVEEHNGTIKAINGNYSGIEGFNGANFVIMLPACEI
ncbi:MAG: hypothetical protein A2X59_05930 [Nitrospirae bacterium GWC2_42_7]|nr:MAG: hypothetical protein A2X59_05930 [Nitrospirae bacterium GWC2_42_7]